MVWQEDWRREEKRREVARQEVERLRENERERMWQAGQWLRAQKEDQRRQEAERVLEEYRECTTWLVYQKTIPSQKRTSSNLKFHEVQFLTGKNIITFVLR